MGRYRSRVGAIVVIIFGLTLLLPVVDAGARAGPETVARAAASDAVILEPILQLHDLGDHSPGAFGPVLAYAGGFAYMAGGGIIPVLDLRPPGGPRLVGQVLPPHEARALLVHRGVLFAAGPGALMSFALDDPAAPRLLGTMPATALADLRDRIGGHPGPVLLTGLGGAAGDYVVLRIVQTLSTFGLPGLAAIDVRDPAQPLPGNVFTSVTDPSRTFIGDMKGLGRYLLVHSASWGTYRSNRINVYDMTAPRVERLGGYDSPREEGSSFFSAMALAGERLMISGEIRQPAGASTLIRPFTWVLDLSDPARIRREAVLPERIEIVAADQGLAVAVSGGRIRAYDVSEPSRPRHLGDLGFEDALPFECTLLAVALHDGRAVLAVDGAGGARLGVVDFADLWKPITAGVAAYPRQPSGAFAVAAGADDRVLAATEGGLHALGFNRGWEPRILASLEPAGPPAAPLRVVVDGARFALASGNLLTRGPVDALVPSQTQTLDAPIRDLDADAGSVATIGEAEATRWTEQGSRPLAAVRGGIALRLLGRYAFLADADGVLVVDADAPMGAEVLGRVPLVMEAGSALAVDRRAGRVFAVARHGDALSLQALRVDAGGGLAAGPVTELGMAAGVPNGVAAVVEDYLILALTDGGLRVIDLADPGRSVEHPLVMTAAEVRAIAALESRYVLLAEGTAGLELMRFHPAPLPVAGFVTPCGVTQRADAEIEAWASPVPEVEVTAFQNGAPIWSGRPADTHFTLRPTWRPGLNTLTLVATNERGSGTPAGPLRIDYQPDRLFDPLGVGLAYPTHAGTVRLHPRDAAGCADPDAGWSVRLPGDRPVTLRVPLGSAASAAVTATLGSETRVLTALPGEPDTFEGTFGPLGQASVAGAAPFDLHIEVDGARSLVRGRLLPPAIHLPVLNPRLP